MGGSQQIPYHRSSILSRPQKLNPVIFVVAVAVVIAVVAVGRFVDGELLTAVLGDILGEEEVGWDGDGADSAIIS